MKLAVNSKEEERIQRKHSFHTAVYYGWQILQLVHISFIWLLLCLKTILKPDIEDISDVL